MKTRITELFGIKHPIIMPGMGIIGNEDLVIAVTNAGGLAFLGSAYMTEDEVDRAIRKIKSQTGGKPFGVNIMEGDPRTKEIAQLVVDEKIPVVGHGKGSPGWLLQMLKQAGCLKVPTVGKLSHALQAEKDGAEAIIVQGTEGGGHTGYISTMVLLPRIARAVKIPIIAAGGFADGRGLVAALALGADGIAMGTRFAIATESPLHQRSKKFYIKATEDDTVVTPFVTGTRSRGIKNRLTEFVDKGRSQQPVWQNLNTLLKLRPIFHFPTNRVLSAAYTLKTADELIGLGKKAGISGGRPPYRTMIHEGNVEWGWPPCGQVIGLIEDILSCKEIIDGTIQEAENIVQSLPGTVLSDR